MTLDLSNIKGRSRADVNRHGSWRIPPGFPALTIAPGVLMLLQKKNTR